MVFQKRNKEASDAKDGKSKTSEKVKTRTSSSSKADAAKSLKQVKDDLKKSAEESSVSSEELSNDMTPLNRGSDDSEGGGSAAESTGSGHSSNGSTPDSTNSANKKSIAVKIPFEPGLRLEAKDLGNEVWYAVKVVEVDWEEEEILIHFEKWSQRYDEWISMDSSRLRPIQEATGPKGSKKGTKTFKVGDRVNATWSDSRKYPATVKSTLPGDKYEVLFMDGFAKVIKGTRMAKLKASDMINVEEFDPEKLGVFKVPEKPPAPPVLSPLVVDAEIIGTKAERRERKRKLNVAELFHVKKRARRSSPPSSMQKVSDMEVDKAVEETPSTSEEQPRGSRQKKPASEDVEDVPDAEMESSAPEIETDTKPPDLPVIGIDNIKKEEIEVKVRRKITPKVRDSDEEDVKPRRRTKREKISEGKSRSSHTSSRTPRKFGRKERAYDVDSSNNTSDSAPVPGTSQEGTPTETPKTKKRESRGEGGDGEKPTSRKAALDTWEPEGEPAYIVESSDGLRKSIIVPDSRLPEGWIKHMIQRKGGHSAGKWDVFFVCPQGRKFRSRHELRNYFEERGEEFPRDQFDFSLGRRKMRWASRDSSSKNSPPPSTSAQGRGKLPVSATSDEQQPIRRVKTLLPKIRVPQPDDINSASPESACPRSPLPPYTTTVASISAARIPDEPAEGEVLVGSLKIQMENDAYMCPKDGCNKHFRKENLLQMHIKHYHPEYNKFMGSTPNVADLAYARTIGEPVEDLIPKARYSIAGPTFLEKINRFEANRKAKSLGASVSPAGRAASPTVASIAPDLIPIERKKPAGKDNKQGLAVAGKKSLKGELEVPSPANDSALAAEDNTTLPGRQDDIPPVLEPAVSPVERKEQLQPTIKTLLPVVRTSTPAQELTLVERLKMRYPAEDAVGDVLLRKDQGSAPQSPQQQPSSSQSQPPILQQQTPLSSQATTTNMPSLTKSMRTVRRKHMSDFHMEPLMRKRKTVKVPELLPEDADLTEDGSLQSDSSSYRYSRKKLPVVHLEKLQTTTDSNASLEGEDRSKSPPLDTPAKTRVEQLRREEIINCICGYNEEDGLMIQCDLCLCWQHGLCCKIEKETDVPEKYVCPICLNPPRERRSKHYLHDQDWVKEGTLPSLSFRSKNLENIKQREMMLKRSHELTASLHQLNQVIHSLRVKVNIAEAPDHPKLYLWAKSWVDEDTKPPPQDEKPLVNSMLESMDSHANNKELEPLLQPKKEEPELPSACSELGQGNGVGDAGPDVKDLKVENWRGSSFSSQNVPYPAVPSNMEEDMCSISSAEPFHLPMSEDEHTSPDPSEERSASSNLVNRGEITSPNRQLSDDEEAVKPSPEPITDDPEISVDSVENANTIIKTENIPVKEEVVVKDETGPTEMLGSDIVHPMEDMIEPAEEIVEAAEETVESSEVVEDNSMSLPIPVEDVKKEEPESNSNSLPSPDPMEGHILHQALTNGLPPINTDDAVDSLQLPICQSELMQLASSMADNLEDPEPVRPRVAQMPVPEAPIDPYECKTRLLDHIEHYHQQIESRLTTIEAQILALESMDPHSANDEAADFYPQTKQTVQMLLRDLLTVQRLATLN